MEQSLKKKLLKSRQAIKQKFGELRNSIVHQENYLEKKFKPIADPLKELLKSVKVEKGAEKAVPKAEAKDESFREEKADVKDESFRGDMTFSSPGAVSSPQQKSRQSLSRRLSFYDSQPRQVSFLDSVPLAQYDPIEEEVEEPDQFLHLEPDKMDEIEQSAAFKEYIDSFGGLAKEYIVGSFTEPRKYDSTYGPRREILTDQDGRQYDTGKFLLGNSYIDFSQDGNLIKITTPEKKTFDYEGSLALYELIFKTIPNAATVNKNEQARRDYKDIIDRTNLHKSGFSSAGQVRSNRGRKYLDFIRQILKEKFDQTNPIRASLSRSSISGKGFINLESKKVQYIPYKNPNTLVNRLKILIGSQLAGNTSHENEIVYILEELKRSKIIK